MDAIGGERVEFAWVGRTAIAVGDGSGREVAFAVVVVATSRTTDAQGVARGWRAGCSSLSRVTTTGTVSCRRRRGTCDGVSPRRRRRRVGSLDRVGGLAGYERLDFFAKNIAQIWRAQVADRGGGSDRRVWCGCVVARV